MLGASPEPLSKVGAVAMGALAIDGAQANLRTLYNWGEEPVPSVLNQGTTALAGYAFDQSTAQYVGAGVDTLAHLGAQGYAAYKISGLIGSGTPFGQATNNVPVARWGRPGLQAGDWVMKGGTSYQNYVLSGKWQPGFTNQFAPYSSGQTFMVSPSTLSWPGGPLGIPKAILGQRIYVGPGFPPLSP